ncbi:MAG TPA: flavin reductase family protein [Solirubrobacteraceae bacterium]|nr:flavin reductase family protein [Solirubrobacteraceae bacterium]
MSATKVTFPRLMAQLDYSMLVVTASAPGGNGHRELAGCLVGFASQVSIRPARFMVCISVKNHTFPVALRSPVLIVHFVPAEAEQLAELFGGETGDEVDKFERCDWRPGPEGVPAICELENWFAGRVIDRIPFGDHQGFVLEPLECHGGSGSASFTFRRAKAIEPGHDP